MMTDGAMGSAAGIRYCLIRRKTHCVLAERNQQINHQQFGTEHRNMLDVIVFYKMG